MNIKEEYLSLYPLSTEEAFNYPLSSVKMEILDLSDELANRAIETQIYGHNIDFI